MQGGNDSADIGTRIPRIQRYSPAGLAALALILFAAGIAAVYAVLFPVRVSDTVSITDQPSLRTTAKDSLDPQEEPSSSQTASDEVSHLDAVSPSTSVADTLGLSDSALVTASMSYQVTTRSILAISDSVYPGTHALDTVKVQDRPGVAASVRDVISILDSAARVFILYITDSFALTDEILAQVQKSEIDEGVEGDHDSDTGGGSGPDRTVYDQSYFEDRPQSKLKATNVDLFDSQDRVITRVLPGRTIDISIAMRNYQNVNQDFRLFVQITDQDNVAIEIVQASGEIVDGAAANVKIPWTTSPPGQYVIQIVICDGNSSPSIISESVSKELVVG